MLKNRKILVLTQPLGNNYGGLLQAYALQVVLKRMEHAVWTEDRKKNHLYLPMSVSYMLTRVNFIRSLLGKPKLWTKKDELILRQYTNRFIRENIQTTQPISSNSKKLLDKYQFDAYIVGSDQVWRPTCFWGIQNYFLDFVKDGNRKKIAFAASYGVDYSEYSKKMQLKCSGLLKQFDAVSVREFGAIKLTRELFNVDAVQMLDPTMLLDKEDYNNVIDKHSVVVKTGSVMVYILDETTEKSMIVQNIATKLGCSVNQIKITKHCGIDTRKNVAEYVIPSVEQWLAGFRDCDFVVTDSFHGTIFSLIYNKPFISIVNKERGTARFESILSQFGLLDRLIEKNATDYIDLANTPIDFDRVNDKREQLKLESIRFLENNL